jgi:hypothetical protein
MNCLLSEQNSRLVELTGSNHNQLEQYENRTHHFTVVQLNVLTQLLAEKKLEAKQKSWKKKQSGITVFVPHRLPVPK